MYNLYERDWNDGMSRELRIKPGADAINISGLLVKESRLLFPRNLGAQG